MLQRTANCYKDLLSLQSIAQMLQRLSNASPTPCPKTPNYYTHTTTHTHTQHTTTTTTHAHTHSLTHPNRPTTHNNTIIIIYYYYYLHVVKVWSWVQKPRPHLNNVEVDCSSCGWSGRLGELSN